MSDFFFGGGFELLFFIVFFLVLGMVIFFIIQGLRQWNRNNHAPRLTVEATVVTKRYSVHHRHDPIGHSGCATSSTSYYVTFQVPSGDRMELPMNAAEYGMLAEGDRGLLSFQGTRYLSFARQ